MELILVTRHPLFIYNLFLVLVLVFFQFLISNFRFLLFVFVVEMFRFLNKKLFTCHLFFSPKCVLIFLYFRLISKQMFDLLNIYHTKITIISQRKNENVLQNFMIFFLEKKTHTLPYHTPTHILL